MRIPFLDLKVHHDCMREELETAIREVIDSNAFAGGPFVAKFEQDFATYCGAANAIGVGNGTDALWLTMLALGIGPGDEVLVPSLTFVATVNAILYVGARPVFVDIQSVRTPLMSLEHAESLCTARTKAVILVHFAGYVADPEPWRNFARRKNLHLLSDAAHAPGLKEVAAFGDAAENGKGVKPEWGSRRGLEPDEFVEVKLEPAVGLEPTTC